MMSLNDILKEAEALPAQERRELIKLLVDSLGDSESMADVEPSNKTRRLSELRGLGKEIWESIDVQKYIDDMRDEWDQSAWK
jgi:hypothetical protein